MPLDINVQTRGPSMRDFQKAEQEFQLKKQQAMLQNKKLQTEIETGVSTNDPAALRLANEYEAALASGNVKKANMIAAFSKIYDKNVTMTPEGDYIPLSGLPEALGQIEFGKESGTQQARDIYEPSREAATSAAKMKAEDTQKARQNFGTAQAEAQKMLSNIDSLFNPETGQLTESAQSIVGVRNPLKGALPFGYNVPGSIAPGAQARLSQLKGEAFLESFNKLKGAGAITEKEGQAATEAMARFDESQSEADFIIAMRELRNAVSAGVKRLESKASLDPMQEFQSTLRQSQQQGIGLGSNQRPDLMPSGVINWEDLP